jgi:recombination protein RecA
MPKTNLASLWKQYEAYVETDQTDQTWRRKFPSGILALNDALGDLDGVTQGLMHIVGPEAVGKTTLAFDFLAQAQKAGLTEIDGPDGPINALFLDFERTYDPDYARICGVDTSKVLNIITPYDEQAFDLALALMLEGIQFVIVDSIPMVVPMSEEDKSMQDNAKMAAEAQLLGRATKRFVRLAKNTDALVIYLNQWRANISPMAHTDKKYYGAKILAHAVKYTIELTRTKRDEREMTIQAFVAKTKEGANGRKIEYKIIQGHGIYHEQHILGLALDYGIVEKGGAWYYYPSKQDQQYKGQGEENAIKNLPIEEIKARVLLAMREEHESTTTE